MPNPGEDQDTGSRQDILDKIAKYLKDDPKNLSTLMCFFADHDNESTKRYIQVLRTVFENDKAFQGIVDKLVEDTKKLENDPNYIRIMADIWNNYLKPNENNNVGVIGQRFDFQLVLSNNNLTKTTAVFNFISTLSKLDSTVQNKVIQLMTKIAEATVGIHVWH